MAQSRRFARASGGNVAMMVALCILPLCFVIGFALDMQRAETTKRKVQDALDAALLSAARHSLAHSDEAAETAGKAAFAASLAQLGVEHSCPTPTIEVTGATGLVTGRITCSVPLTFASIMGPEDMMVSAQGDAAYGGLDVEVALMIDVSGSMNGTTSTGTRLGDLQNAARGMISTLIPVSGTGEVRIALVPYATSLNAGAYGDVATGITDLYAHTVENLGADPNQLVAALANGGASESFNLVDTVGTGGLGSLPPEFFACAAPQERIVCGTTDTSGDGCLDGTWYTVDIMTLDPSAYPLHVCNSHLDDDDDVSANSCAFDDTATIASAPDAGDCIDGSGTSSQIATDWRNLNWDAALIAAAEYDFSLLGSVHAANLGSMNCVTERDGIDAFTNVSPISSPVGAESSSCPSAAVEPLTHDTTILNNAIDSLQADGWTAGHLGVAWSWYMLSDTWSTVWPLGRRAAAKNPAAVKKIAVLMTDGSFNTHYATGQGSSVPQARSLCDAMKLDGIEIHAVAFDAPAAGQAVLQYCASSSDTYYTAANAAQLTAAYDEIAQSINQIRLTK